MESALYDPQNGYYSNRTVKADFYTAPELHPAFSGVLTREIVKRLRVLKTRGVSQPYSIVEVGSGSGLLARQILQDLRKNYPEWAQTVRYVLVERSSSALMESVESLSGLNDHLLGLSQIEDLLPCAGVFLSNELLDAFPVHLLEKADGKVCEVYVEPTKTMRLGRLSTPRLRPYAERMDAAGDGERHAVNLEALRWLGAIAKKISAGFLITIDYGSRFPSGACNPPRTFFKHFQGTDDLTQPGRDITSNVDFEALIEEGRKSALELESYSTLSRFLLDGGIEEWIGPDADSLENFKNRSKIKTLLHPEGMGEIFKVLIQSKGLSS